MLREVQCQDTPLPLHPEGGRSSSSLRCQARQTPSLSVTVSFSVNRVGHHAETHRPTPTLPSVSRASPQLTSSLWRRRSVPPACNQRSLEGHSKLAFHTLTPCPLQRRSARQTSAPSQAFLENHVAEWVLHEVTPTFSHTSVCDAMAPCRCLRFQSSRGKTSSGRTVCGNRQQQTPPTPRSPSRASRSRGRQGNLSWFATSSISLASDGCGRRENIALTTRRGNPDRQSSSRASPS